jgi:hypothetical protein
LDFALELARDPHRGDGGEPVPLGILKQRQLRLQDHGVEIAHRVDLRRPLDQRLHHKGQLHGEGWRTGAAGDVLALLAPKDQQPRHVAGGNAIDAVSLDASPASVRCAFSTRTVIFGMSIANCVM